MPRIARVSHLVVHHSPHSELDKCGGVRGLRQRCHVLRLASCGAADTEVSVGTESAKRFPLEGHRDIRWWTTSVGTSREASCSTDSTPWRAKAVDSRNTLNRGRESDLTTNSYAELRSTSTTVINTSRTPWTGDLCAGDTVDYSLRRSPNPNSAYSHGGLKILTDNTTYSPRSRRRPCKLQYQAEIGTNLQ